MERLLKSFQFRREDAAFPSPRPSPQRRGRTACSLQPPERARRHATLSDFLPLPKGEGRGEGKRAHNPTASHRRFTDHGAEISTCSELLCRPCSSLMAKKATIRPWVLLRNTGPGIASSERASGTSGTSGFHAVVDAHRAAEKIDDADVAAAEALHRGAHTALCGVSLE